MFLQHLIPRKGTQLGWAGVRWMRVGWAGSRVLGFVWGVFFLGGVQVTGGWIKGGCLGPES